MIEDNTLACYICKCDSDAYFKALLSLRKLGWRHCALSSAFGHFFFVHDQSNLDAQKVYEYISINNISSRYGSISALLLDLRTKSIFDFMIRQKIHRATTVELYRFALINTP